LPTISINKTTFYLGETVVIHGYDFRMYTYDPSVAQAQFVWYKDDVRQLDLWSPVSPQTNECEWRIVADRPGNYSGFGRCFPTSQSYELSNTVYWTVLSTPPPKKKTSLVLGVEPTSGSAPLSVNIRVLLRDEDGAPLSGKLIKIYKNGLLFTTLTTGGQGTAETNDSLDVGTYNYQAEFEGDDQYEGC